MISLNNLPNNCDVQWFNRPTVANEVFSWTKPYGCNFVYIMAAGAGGSGGGSGSYSGLNVAYGGGGGGSGAIQTLLIPAFLLPNSLFLTIGKGGGGAGGSTIVSAYRISSTTEYFLNASGGAAGSGGGLGSQGYGGGGGAANPVSSSPLASLGMFRSWAGDNGLNGDFANNNAADKTLNYINVGGVGGSGNSNFGNGTGPGILCDYLQPTSTYLVPRNIAGAGYFLKGKFAFVGGGSNNNGSFGATAGTAYLTSGGPGASGFNGIGGRGGDGFVLIISY